MRIQLPVETWIDILDWLNRRDLLNKLEQLWDREFTPIVQDWLHKYTRNVKIREMEINFNDGGVSVRSYKKWEKIPFADVELPENVISFERISISYMDSNVLAFLRRLRPLFHNICLENHSRDELSIQTAIHHLMPMIGSIDSIILDCKLLQFLSTNYPSTMSNAKLLNIYYSKLDDTSEQWLINWLFTPRADSQPRTLVLSSLGEGPACFLEKIRERFLDPAHQTACPFFIRTRNNLPNALTIENVQTGEHLAATVNGVFGLISNCCARNNVDPEWLGKKTKEVLKWNITDEQKVIWLRSPHIGPLNHADESAEEAI